MYLTHHYLIDVVAGACLATFVFYYFLPAELKEWETGGVGRFEEYSLVDRQFPIDFLFLSSVCFSFSLLLSRDLSVARSFYRDELLKC